jgi:hypothetical protein
VLEELGNAQKVRVGGLVQLTVRVKPAQKKRKEYGQHKAEKSISRLEWFAANCGTGALGLPAGRVA